MRSLLRKSGFLTICILVFGIFVGNLAHAQNTTRTSQQVQEYNDNTNALDVMSKTISSSIMDEILKFFDSGGTQGLSYFLAFMVLLQLLNIVKEDGATQQFQLKKILNLCMTTLVIGSAVSTKIYQSTGLPLVMANENDQTSGRYLSLDAVFKLRDFSTQVIVGFVGTSDQVSERLRIARENMSWVVATGENSSEAQTELNRTGDTPQGETAYNTCVAESMTPMGKFVCWAQDIFTFNYQFNMIYKLLDYILLAFIFFFQVFYSVLLGANLMMFTLIAPIGILPQYTKRIWDSYKPILSFGLFSAFVLLMNALNAAALFGLANGYTKLPTGTQLALSLVMLLVAILINLVNIFIVFKIPKFCKSLLDGNLDMVTSVVSEGLGAVVGMGTMIGSLATGGAALAMAGKGLGKGAAGAIGDVVSKGIPGGDATPPSGGMPGQGDGQQTNNNFAQSGPSQIKGGVNARSFEDRDYSPEAKSILKKRNRADKYQDAPEGMNIGASLDPNMFKSLKPDEQRGFDLSDSDEDNFELNEDRVSSKSRENKVNVSPVGDDSEQLAFAEAKPLLAKNRLTQVKDGISNAKNSIQTGVSTAKDKASEISNKLDQSRAGRIAKGAANLTGKSITGAFNVAKKSSGVGAKALGVATKIATSRKTWGLMAQATGSLIQSELKGGSDANEFLRGMDNYTKKETSSYKKGEKNTWNAIDASDNTMKFVSRAVSSLTNRNKDINNGENLNNESETEYENE